MKRIGTLAALALLGLAYAETPPPTVGPHVYTLPDAEVATLLGWITDPLAHNLCHGYYKEALIHYDFPANSSLLDFYGDQSYLVKKGPSTLVGNVVLKEYEQEVTADKGYLYRDPQGHPTQAVLTGHVRLNQPTQLIVADSATMMLPSHHWRIHNALFRSEVPSKNPDTIETHDLIKLKKDERRVYQLSAWGRTTEITQDTPGVTHLEDATYSTCAPNCQDWHLHAAHIVLDKNTGRGHAKNSTLYIKNTPIFWVPYIDFPIDKRRQTGFLNPTYGTTKNNGADISAPFYWNLAPNYDTTITPRYMSKRGTQLNDESRYLTQDSKGDVGLSFMPKDQAFNSQKTLFASEYAGLPNRANQISDLQDAPEQRHKISWQDHTYFNANWNAQIDYTRVSDDYYLEDFGYTTQDYSEDQLLQQALLTYNDEDSSFGLNTEHYQTLHPLDQADVDNQYSRLPQLNYSHLFNYHPWNVDMGVGSDLTNFGKTKNPFDINSGNPTVGQRLNLQPSVSLPLTSTAWFATPRMQYMMTDYHTLRANPGMPADPGRAVPIFDIDTGLYFDRNNTILGKEYTQTIEPEMYYLYVPYRQQNNLPLFDTVDNSGPTTFNYDDMFNYNRFSGPDRIGDANQLTVAVTSRYREHDTGLQKLSASIGEILYANDRHVQACTTSNANNPDQTACSNTLPDYSTQKRSPIAGLFTYSLNSLWNLNGNLAYNTRTNQMENTTTGFSYRSDYRHLLNVSYTFARHGDPDQLPGIAANSAQNNLKQSTVSFAWPLSYRFESLGQWNFNWSHQHLQAYLYGIEYDSCCWAVRAVVSRVFTGLSSNFHNEYDTRFYLQFALKGFSRLGSSDPSGLLLDNITNYNDYFGEDY